MARGGFWSGGVMGRSISIVQGEDPNERVGATMRDAMRHAVGHEGFHLWHVQWRINPDDLPGLYWLMEGTAEYYWALISARRGVFGADVLLNEIARHHAAYLNALPGGSIAAAGRTKLDNRSSQDRVYSGGFTAALALDFMIRRETGGAKSLDDVMRRIHARFGQSGAQVLTPARLIQTIRDATGVSAERFFASHVDGVDPIALSDHLLEAGVCLETRRGDQGWSATAVRCDAVTPDQETTWRAWVGGLDLSVPRLRPPEPAQPERPRNAPQRP
jgi:predicted metalloprotease with PDZ domain